LRDKSLLVAHSDDHRKLFRYLISDLKAGDLLVIQGYMRLNLDRIAAMIVNFKDTNKFDPAIHQTALDAAGVLAYKKLLALEDLEKRDLPLAVRNRYELEDAIVHDLLRGGITFRQCRAAKLFTFFEQLGRLAVSEFALQCANNGLRQGGHENMIYTPNFCDSWFNNIDKIAGQPKKQLFGSFYAFGDRDYLFLVVVGSTNLHIGFAKYAEINGKYDLVAMAPADYEELLERFGHRLPEHIELKPRSWGKKWLTIDCGSFIDLSRPEVFAAMYDLEQSALYEKTIAPLLQVVTRPAG
jgi:hypothetical protein